MKKLSILLIPTLIACIFAGVVTPVHASDREDEISLSVDDISREELRELDKLELVPVPILGKEVSINGGFQGVWGTNVSTDARLGETTGLYHTLLVFWDIVPNLKQASLV